MGKYDDYRRVDNRYTTAIARGDSLMLVNIRIRK